jgi:hypothetical protein
MLVIVWALRASFKAASLASNPVEQKIRFPDRQFHQLGGQGFPAAHGSS